MFKFEKCSGLKRYSNSKKIELKKFKMGRKTKQNC
jgi:hypothetical protein